MVAWARKYGMNSTIRTGGPSIPGSGLIDKDTVLEADADVIGPVNGGHRAHLRALDCGRVEVGRAADFVIVDRAQMSAGKTLLESLALGDIPGVAMTIIDGIVRTGRSRNTPPATTMPQILAG